MSFPSIEERSGSAPEWYGMVVFSKLSSSKPPLIVYGNTANIETILFGKSNCCQLIFEGYLYDQRQLAASIGIKKRVF